MSQVISIDLDALGPDAGGCSECGSLTELQVRRGDKMVWLCRKCCDKSVDEFWTSGENGPVMRQWRPKARPYIDDFEF